MTNKEKEQYISDLNIYRSNMFSAELMRKTDFLSRMPKVLYKYRKFDNFTIEMIEENYVYLAPVKGLDDPFDCLVNPGADGTEKNEDNIDFVMSIVKIKRLQNT